MRGCEETEQSGMSHGGKKWPKKKKRKTDRKEKSQRETAATGVMKGREVKKQRKGREKDTEQDGKNERDRRRSLTTEEKR